MNDDEFGDRMIAFWRRRIALLVKTLPQRLAANDLNGVLMNHDAWGEAHFGIGIVQWRRGEDPRAEFSAGLDAIAQGAAVAIAGNADPQDIDQLNLYVAQPIAFLMDRTLPYLKGSVEQQKELPMIAASELLADALFDRPYRERLPAIIQALGTKKRQMLALLSFQTYFEVLDEAGDEARIAALAAQGDALYLRRAKDVYYDAVMLGGGDYNRTMIDWQLAAVLKKVGFKGESIHRWRWG